MIGRGALTLSQLLAEVEHLGGDPATTTFEAALAGGPITHEGGYSIERREGVLVVDLSGEIEDFDDGADELRMQLVAAEHDLGLAMNVVDAAREWAKTGRSGAAFDHMHASLKLLAALDAHAAAEVSS